MRADFRGRLGLTAQQHRFCMPHQLVPYWYQSVGLSRVSRGFNGRHVCFEISLVGGSGMHRVHPGYSCTRTENPRVGGSNPPLGTTNFQRTLQLVAEKLERPEDVSDVLQGRLGTN